MAGSPFKLRPAVKATFDASKHITTEKAAKLVGFNKNYFTSTVIRAYGLVPFRQGSEYFFEKTAIENLKKQVERHRVNEKLSPGKLVKLGRRNRAVIHTGVKMRTSPAKSSPHNKTNGKPSGTTVVISPKTLMQMVKDGLPIRLEVSE